MRQIFTTTQSPSIQIVQTAYEEFFTPVDAPTDCDTRLFVSIMLGLDQSVAVATTQDNWLRFQTLAAAWREQRGVMSSVTESVLCPAYQCIIGMGDEAVPFLLRQLGDEGDDPDQWFWALKAITGADPVKEDDRGNNLLMARSWFEWGVERGYAW